MKIAPDVSATEEEALQVLTDYKTAAKTVTVGTYVTIDGKNAFTKEIINFNPDAEVASDDEAANGASAMAALAATIAAAALF